MADRAAIAALKDGEKFTALMDKVDGNPAEIRRIAQRWRNAGNDALGNMNRLEGGVTKVDKGWSGESADAFVAYMTKYGTAGTALNNALVDCAMSLDDAARALEKAKGLVDGAGNDLLTDVATIRARYKGKESDDPKVNVDDEISKTVNSYVGTAQPYVDTADTALSTAMKAINKRFGEEKLLFEDIPKAGDQTWADPNHKVHWVATPPKDSTGGTESASADGGSGNSDGGGTGSYDYTGTSSGGTTPQPKEKIVDWIKQAITIMKSPEMKDALAKRGINVDDLDPNDPKDIERIWTVIYHESGGNPSAINNWDINAQNGVPSQGLMQTIPPTFDANSLPGHKQILDPVDNIIAGVLYTYKRYGDMAHHPGIYSIEHGGGYRPY
ncbi:WXG100 family type VII secretion target [Nonomuraea sediminis]|uniref:WXG100 family type VII secretion target n=1 Tax=Nonomuraea sediminis TaxID=2835864 RepID=UPI001BDBF8A1|nr:transglycosylase SLT domain-containing protein [Nonomuraea sediminis]